jgi:hypothetical protein
MLLSFSKRFFVLSVFVLALGIQARAVPTLINQFAMGGTSYQYVSGVGNVIQPGAQVYITTKFFVGGVIVHSGGTVITAGDDGRWQTEMPCYMDVNGPGTSYFEVLAYVAGVFGLAVQCGRRLFL